MEIADNGEPTPIAAGLAEAIESFSLIIEQFGLPRMAGRVFAALSLIEEGAATQSELSDMLQASTGSVSTMTRLLEQLGFMERVSIPGDRRDRFQLRPDPLVEMSKRRIEGVIHMINAVEKAQHNKDIGPLATARLNRAESFYRFFHIEMELALVRWLEDNPLSIEEPPTD
jgi:DNA-binding transcriptional regulator GbsR (MarR family)